ncbi:2-methylaconitate cis-trans isomerase PrpF [Chitinimonas arctica]|uniref:2-methylaconitate cis-trans isomerase PrpF n=1 Tax=Chitinimonas arctica TaxID=2594795 RepID=A0A516SD13_9NEIS|nr:PrpF domain-containing protein [Chitinimonas arctica]QDQ26049.1 2-methylaconitate cis-trans isomerase PrpF [Chitinimonas arctica]
MALYRIAATLMRGGTSKGVFFRADVLPADTGLRDRLLARLIGSPDPYEKQMDGLGTGISSTSKVVLVSKSSQVDCDVDYLFGHVSIRDGSIDWSGNCGNLSAAVGPFALLEGLLAGPADGLATVRIWQANTGKRIVATLPMRDGLPAQQGEFRLDGLAFPAAPIKLDFLDPAGGAAGALFPTGRPMDRLSIPGIGELQATLIDAGNPLIILRAEELGLTALETPALNSETALLQRLETIRAHATVRMGLAEDPAQASRERPSNPKLCWIAPPAAFLASDGREVECERLDLLARIVSMGKLHHGFTGTGTIALAAAAALPGTLVADLLGGPLGTRPLRFGHPGGVNEIETVLDGERVSVSRLVRSARVLMRGEAWVALEE